MRAPVALALMMLAGCAAQAPAPETATPGPTAEPEVLVTLALPRSEAMDLVEKVAARCWLDAELQASALIANRLQYEFTLVGETEKLLRARLSLLEGARTRVRLTGQAIEDSARATRLVSHLRRAEDTGQTAC